MSSDDISKAYEILFAVPDLIPQIKAEFRLYTLLHGEQALEQQLTAFKTNGENHEQNPDQSNSK